LNLEPSEENLSEHDTEFTGDDTVEPDIPQKLTKEELNLQLNVFRRSLIEGALYAAGRPLDVEELSTKLEIPKKEVEELVKVVAFDYLEREGALIVAQIGEKYQMQLRPELTETVSKFAKGGAISERYLRTLTVIALKQPILKSTIIKIRGSGAYEHVKYLLDNDLIISVKKGRSAELSTTDKYADMFGLPKDKLELKRMMISQLDLGENAS
jgi:segregation and condensation protein B